MKIIRATLLLTLLASSVCGAPVLAEQAPSLRVAFVISDGFNVMDFAGPWEVFQDVMLPAKKADSAMAMPFTLYTVSSSRHAVKSTGGAEVIPQYSLANAPQPDIVVIGAQADNSPELLAWLRAQNAAGVTIMSVCTGARKLALSGLIDGKPATSHHEFIGEFQKQFPKVRWQTAKRFVQAADNIYTAGGLTSGIDLALHLVSKRFGAPVAQATADYMEYRSDGWKEPAQVSQESRLKSVI